MPRSRPSPFYQLAVDHVAAAFVLVDHLVVEQIAGHRVQFDEQFVEKRDARVFEPLASQLVYHGEVLVGLTGERQQVLVEEEMEQEQEGLWVELKSSSVGMLKEIFIVL